MALVSVIIPAYNAEKTIRRCIESVTGQSYSNIELIIVDDGSDDDTVKICRKYEKQFSNIEVICQENKGVVSARARGVAEARGEYISFIDSDDEMKPDMIKKMVGAIIRDKADIAICGYDSIKADTQTVSVADTCGKITEKDKILQLYLDGNVLGFLWNRLYKKQLFRNIRWKEGMEVCEDLYINCQLLVMHPHMSVTVLPQSLYCYYQNNESVTHSLSKKVDEDGAWKYLKAYQQIGELFAGKKELQGLIFRAQLVCVRLGIEELHGMQEYFPTKKKLMAYGRKRFPDMLKTDFPCKYKAGWFLRVILG